jgi:hypothetical protein
MGRRSVEVLFDEEMGAGCRSTLCSMVSGFTDGNCSSTKGRCGVAALVQLDELELDERRLSVRRSDGSRLAK